MKNAENTSAKSGARDYRVYRAGPVERLAAVLITSAVSAAAGLLFYKSLLPAVLGMAAFPLTERLICAFLRERRRESLISQFCDGMSACAAAVRAGHSPERGFGEAREALERIYGEDCILAEEFRVIGRRLSIGEPLERALTDLAERSGIKEVSDMAEVFAAAKRSGGSLPAILRESVAILEQKKRLREEIRTMMTAKRLEQRLMCLMPAGIILYVNVTGADFVAPLYAGFTGRAVMTVFLAVYAAMVVIGERIMKVKL